jgi:tetratricopeptide (TPR) repeat protein
VIELLKNYFEIADEDDEKRRSQKVETKVSGLGLAPAETLPYILNLLGIAGAGAPLGMMDARIRRQRTLEAVKHIVIRESAKQPLVVIFEDLHWIDVETQELLDLLLESLANARLLVLVNYRPEYRHEWGSKSYYLQLRLDPLGGDSADEMLRALLGGDASLEFLKRLIIEKTRGNPFFIEEIVRALVEQGMLVRDGTIRLTRPLTEIRIPPTVQGILASRIDALPAPEKSLLQTLAVIGKDFPLNLVRHMSSSPDDRLQPMLKDLQSREFIYEEPALGEAAYSFKHVLTQEVAYNSVLIERRRLLHERTGEAIEALYKDRIDDHLAELAHHYSRSANTPKAAEYLFRAGNQAAARFAHSEAITQLSGALELLKRLPDDAERHRQELSALSALGSSVSNSKGWAAEDLGPVYAKVRELSAKIHDTALGFRALHGQWLARWWGRDLREALRLSDELLAAAEDTKDSTMLLTANFSRGVVLCELGELLSANEHQERALAAFDLQQPLAAGLENLRVSSLGWLHGGLNRLGYLDRALAKSNEMLEVAQRCSYPEVAIFASYQAAYHHLERGDSAVAQKRAEEAMAVTEKMGLASISAMSTTCYGAALIAQGRCEEGIAAMRRGFSAFRSTGGTPRIQDLCFLASGLGKAGRPEEGLRIVKEGLASVVKTGEELVGSPLLRVKGELLLVQNSSNIAEAEQCFRGAIEIARRQRAKTEELRATTSLARLLAKQGKRDVARAMIAEIYGWFTEGFDTADLKDAKALLDELSI